LIPSKPPIRDEEGLIFCPPFDDPHVRKAVNFIMDKAALAKAFGGSRHGVPATSIEPPTVLPDTATYDPYPSANHAGDLAAAQAEMKQSKYDTNQDGMCDAPQCSGFVFLGRSFSWGPAIDQIMVNDLTKIGLNADLKETETGYDTLVLVKKLIPISAYPGWGKDFASPFGFDYYIFNSAGIACTGASNYANVGLTDAKAKECGVESEYNSELLGRDVKLQTRSLADNFDRTRALRAVPLAAQAAGRGVAGRERFSAPCLGEP